MKTVGENLKEMEDILQEAYKNGEAWAVRIMKDREDALNQVRELVK